MRRPSWWPRDWWPGADEDEERPDVAPRVPRPGREAGDRPSPGEGWTSLLTVLRETLQCGRATLWRLTSGGAEWRVVAEVTGSGWGEASPRVVDAPGHPFTWALKEELELQVPAERLGEAAGPDGWALVAPVRSFGLCVCLWFSSPPRPAAREAVEAIRRHTAWCAWGESRGGAPGQRGEAEAGGPGGGSGTDRSAAEPFGEGRV